MEKNKIYILDDQIVEFFINKRRVPPVLIGLLSAVIPLVILATLAFVFGEFRSHDGTIGFVDDFNLFNNYLLGVAPVVTFYFLLPLYIQECFEKLAGNNVFRSSRQRDDLNTLLPASFSKHS